MIRFQKPKSHICSIARGLLIHGEEIILCQVKDAKWFFLPGGHIEDGESAKTALLRELHEEIGDSNYKINSFIGVCENIFSLEKDVLQHEINIIFKVDVPNKLKVNTKEDHIKFVSIAKNNLKDYEILPLKLKDGLIEWLENEKPFLKEV
jgi:8-oxo-dGTP diphosphatase